jgi:hypothetical protein
LALPLLPGRPFLIVGVSIGVAIQLQLWEVGIRFHLLFFSALLPLHPPLHLFHIFTHLGLTVSHHFLFISALLALPLPLHVLLFRLLPFLSSLLASGVAMRLAHSALAPQPLHAATNVNAPVGESSRAIGRVIGRVVERLVE